MQILPEVHLVGYSALTTLLVAAAFLMMWSRLRWTRLLSFGASFASLGMVLVYIAIGIHTDNFPFRQQIAAAGVISALVFLIAGSVSHCGLRVPWRLLASGGSVLWIAAQIINASTGVLSVTYIPFLTGLAYLFCAALFAKYRVGRGDRILSILFLLRGAIHMPWPFIVFTPLADFVRAMDQALVLAIGLALIVSELLRARAELASANATLQDQAHALMIANDKLDQERQLAVSASNAKSAFLANMSHEFRTPLNAIMGFSEVLADHPRGKLAERSADYGRDIHTAATILLDFVDQILELSRLEANRIDFTPETLDVECLVDRAIDAARSKHGANPAAIVKHFEEGTGSVEGDERLLRQALIGILNRALRLSDKGGSVRILAGPEIENSVRIEVTDHGPPLDTTELAEAFNPFHVSDAIIVPKGGGIDLGLPLAKRFIEVHGGAISIDSSPDAGTTVSIDLPRHPSLH